jgi:maleate cis-trans isomerase
MTGWHTAHPDLLISPAMPALRLGFLIPPGNPTTEPEVIRMTPPGVTVHFTRMVARGEPGSLQGQEERNRSQIAHLPENVELLALVKPKVIVLAHTATSYTLGRDGERELTQQIERTSGIPFITAFGSVVLALAHLGARRVAFGTPYGEAATLQCKANLENHGFEVTGYGRLDGVSNIYDETPERAAGLARRVDTADADAVFLSGVGMPTIDVLERLERELGKPVISSAAAMMWNALRVAGFHAPVDGFGRLLAGSAPAPGGPPP